MMKMLLLGANAPPVERVTWNCEYLEVLTSMVDASFTAVSRITRIIMLAVCQCRPTVLFGKYRRCAARQLHHLSVDSKSSEQLSQQTDPIWVA